MTERQNFEGQLGFDDLLANAEEENRQRVFDREAAHLPATMEEALGFYWKLLDDHDAAMVAADVNEAMRLREQAHLLALKLNGGDPGILAHSSSPGYVLEQKTAATEGAVPLWGQKGAFTVCVNGIVVLIRMDGIFGIASSHCYWPGFSATVVDCDRPFLSETGYRSFLGIHGTLSPGMTPESFTREVCIRHIETTLKGKLVPVLEQFRGACEA